MPLIGGGPCANVFWWCCLISSSFHIDAKSYHNIGHVHIHMLSLCVCLLSLSDHSTIRICEENFVTSRTKLSCSLVRVGLHLAHSLAMSVEHLPAPHHAVHHRRPLLLNRLALL